MPPSENGWERWRGEVDQRLEQDCERIENLETWRVNHEEFARKSMLDIVNRIGKIEGKVLLMTTLGSFGGAVLGAVLAWFLGKV